MTKLNTTKKRGAVDMIYGSLWKNIMFFSLPLMLSQVLEVMFNMADVAVVGKFSSSAALGSVGSTTLLVSLFIGLLIGMGCGINVRTARQLGAGRTGDVSCTVHTSLILCLITGISLSVICIAFAKPMLEILNTKSDLIDGAVLYFRIYSLGMPAMAVYNFGNAVMSAGGDTKRPLIYLSVSGLINIVLNLIFVIGFGMAADGVALASIVSQYGSAVLVLINLFRRTDCCRLKMSDMSLNRQAARDVLLIGIPAGMQNAIFAVANLFIQTGVNSFDSVMVSGNAAAANADAIIFNVMAAFYTACSSFMGQNLGAGRDKRAIHSYFISLLYSFSAGAVLGVILLIYGRQFLSLFTYDTAVIDAGMQRIKIMGFSYGVGAFMDCTIAASRGIGKSIIPTILVILGSCIFRIFWVYTVFAHFHTIASLYLVYIFSWSITAAAEILYFAVCYRHRNDTQEIPADNSIAVF